MSTQAIYCPGQVGINGFHGGWVPLEVYIRGIRLAIANPDAIFKCGLTTWYPTNGREIRRQFWEGVQGRINQGIPYSQRGDGR